MARAIFQVSLTIATVAAVPSVVRRTGYVAVDSQGAQHESSPAANWVKADLDTWRQAHEKFEAKKMDVTSRDFLWQAVQEVDSAFNQAVACDVQHGFTFFKDAAASQEQTTFVKAGISSSRECALMCAASAVVHRSAQTMPCKSFTFNNTIGECRFLHSTVKALRAWSFAQEAHNAGIKNSCCSSGAPCELGAMRARVEQVFDVKVKTSLDSEAFIQMQKDSQEGVDFVPKETSMPSAREHADPKEGKNVFDHMWHAGGILGIVVGVAWMISSGSFKQKRSD